MVPRKKQNLVDLGSDRFPGISSSPRLGGRTARRMFMETVVPSINPHKLINTYAFEAPLHSLSGFDGWQTGPGVRLEPRTRGSPSNARIYHPPSRSARPGYAPDRCSRVDDLRLRCRRFRRRGLQVAGASICWNLARRLSEKRDADRTSASVPGRDWRSLL